MWRWAFVVIVLLGCAPLQRNSPFSEQTLSRASHLNAKAINQLGQRDQTPQDITILAMSDSHQNYDDLDNTVTAMNSYEADFVVHAGDFTNQGFNIEYDLFIFRMKELRFPFIVTLGNHDTLTKGKVLYKRLFGDFNQMFEYRGYRFIILNNNRLDFYSSGGVDWAWLERAVITSTVPIVLIYHINPDNTDYFTQDDRTRFENIITGSRVRLMLHGHHHVIETEVKNGIVRHMIHRTQGTKWSRILLRAHEILVENCEGKVCVHDTTQAFP